MGKPTRFLASWLIPRDPDRHAERLEIIQCGPLVHINFRNLQIKLTAAEFREWQTGFTQARRRLGERMLGDL